MFISSISPVNHSASKIQVPRMFPGNTLEERPYLFNEVTEILRKNSVTSVFKKDGVDIFAPTKKIIEELTEKGIKFLEA